MSLSKNLRGVLLDVDGTLVLSNDAHAETWVKAFEELGYKANYDKVRKLIGMGGDKLIKEINPDLNKESGDGKKISDYRSELFLSEYAPKLEPAPGSRALVEHLKEKGYELVVASSSTNKEIEALLKAAQVEDLLPQTTTSDDADESKPDPDIIHAALDKTGLPPDQVVLLGDTPYDIEAAAKAGVQVIAVRCGGWSDEDLRNAIAIYDNPAALLESIAS